MKYFNYFILIFILNKSVCNTHCNTTWGNCIIINNEISYTNQEICDLVLNKTSKLNTAFGLSDKKNEFTLIIDNGESSKGHPHWEWSLGRTYRLPEKIIMKDPASAHISKRKFNIVLEHELNHVMVNRIDNKRTIPRWFKEGFAMFYSNEITLNHKLQVAQKIHIEELFNIYDLDNFSGFDKSRFNLAYAQSAIYVLSINQLYGDHTLHSILINMKNGKTFKQAFYETTGNSLTDFNLKIYKHIKTKYGWFKLIALPNQLFVFFPLLLVLGFIMRSVRNKKIEEKWKIEEELEQMELLKIEENEIKN